MELKAVKALKPEHHAQLINYLKATDIEGRALARARPGHRQVINYLKATNIEVGLLINFGNPKPEFKRFTRRKNS